MNELALFAGAGGGILGGKLLGWRTVCAVEIDPYCREILLRRQRDSLLPLFPIWDDVRTFKGQQWNQKVDIVSAGFPCQPFSTAGRRKGEEDNKNLWPETIRVIREVGPRLVLLENVPGLLSFDYFGTILGDLAESGFDAEWDVVSASSVGAPHRRERLWVLAYSKGIAGPSKASDADCRSTRNRADVSRGWNNARSLFGKDYLDYQSPDTTGRAGKSPFCLVVDGVAGQVDQLRAIGNGQVPQVAAAAFLLLARRAGIIS